MIIEIYGLKGDRKRVTIWGTQTEVLEKVSWFKGEDTTASFTSAIQVTKLEWVATGTMRK